MTALPEELREHVETVAAGILNVKGSGDKAVAALDALTAHLSRQHELLREAEEAMNRIVTYTPEGFISPMDDEDSMNYRAIARSWIARYREQGDAR